MPLEARLLTDIGMNNRASLSDILDFVALSLLCLFGAGYSLLNRSFAQIHLQLPFLRFPVFIGEILLAVCCALWLTKQIIRGFPSFRRPVSSSVVGAAVLGVFILLKVLTGYLEYGPLALRNSALFYYAFFAWLAAAFYNKKFFTPAVNAVLLFFLLTFLLVRPLQCYMYFMFSYIFLSLAQISRLRNKRVRWFLVSFMLLFLPYLMILKSSRANILACIAGLGVFFMMKMAQNIGKGRLLRFFLGGITFLAVAAFFVLSFSRTEEINSLIRVKSLVTQFKETDRYIESRQPDYTMRAVPVRLYSKDNTVDFMGGDSRILESDTVFMLKKIKDEISPDTPEAVAGRRTGSPSPSGTPARASSSDGTSAARGRPDAPTEPANNILWRLLVWRDMIRDASQTHPVFGMYFGKPFRSSSIEILGWNKLELEGVGWMEPHNSYVHIFYRAGWVGVGMIIILLLSMLRLTLRFVQAKDGTGPFLIAALVYWLVVANFLVTLELPFFAIPFWSLLGLTWGYSRGLARGPEPA